MKDPYLMQRVLDMIANQPQRQDSLNDQLETMIPLANKMGCHDAADFIKRMIANDKKENHQEKASRQVRKDK